ncbi:hypothetical protein RSAG8_11281, partial [Rhizoctonia solani AG-8 WAC10335]
MLGHAIGRAFTARQGPNLTPTTPRPSPDNVHDIHALRATQPALTAPTSAAPLSEHLALAAAPGQPSLDKSNDVHALEPAQLCLPKRPNTPGGLREVIYGGHQLRKAARGRMCYGIHGTPCPLPPGAAPLFLPLPDTPSEPLTPAYPYSPPPEVFDVQGRMIDRYVAWIIA